MLFGPVFDDLTSDQLREFRMTWIRDFWNPSTASGQSRFNQANRRNFFEDDDLRILDQRLRGDLAEELDALWQEKFEERLGLDDGEDDARAAALDAQLTARMRELAASCMELMMDDPAFRASLIVGEINLGPAIFKQWQDRIVQHRTWTRSRTGAYATIEVERG